MSDEAWVIPIPEENSKIILNESIQNKDNVFMLDKSTLINIQDFPENYVFNKIDSIIISTSASDNNKFTVCLSIFRHDKNNVDIDLVGLLFLDESTPTTSACYIRHGDWHQNRTMSEAEAQIILKEFSAKINKDLKTSPGQILAGHKRINNFLMNKTEQSKSRKSKYFTKNRKK